MRNQGARDGPLAIASNKDMASLLYNGFLTADDLYTVNLGIPLPLSAAGLV